MEDTEITIVIPNFNGKKLLSNCLESIASLSFKNYEIIVVDNGSSDDSVTYLQKVHKKVEIMQFMENKGFSAAINAGIKKARGEYVCLLNNDVEVDQQFLEEMFSALEGKKDIDYCAPKMLSYHERNRIDGVGDGVLRAGVGYRIGSREYDNGLFDSSKEVFGACAGAAMYRKSFFEKVGFFDEDFFAYLEDVDLNFRANLFGVKCLFVPSAKVFHIGGATTGGPRNRFITQFSVKNIFNVIIKNYPISIILKGLPLFCLFHIYRFFVITQRGQLRAYFWGIRGALQDFPKMWRKRKEILYKKKVSNKEFWMIMKKSEREYIESLIRQRRIDGKLIWPIELYMKIFLAR